MKDDRVHLCHILDCAERIELYIRDGQAAFAGDFKTQDAVLRNLQTLAESVRRLSDTLKEKHPEVAWRDIAAFRNVVVHDYLGLDLNLIWAAAQHDVPALKAQITPILSALDEV